MPSPLALALNEARRILPLPRMLQRMGLASATADRKAECPFCHDKTGKFSVYKDVADRWFFKCHKQKCDGNQNDFGHNEIAFLQLNKGLAELDAMKEFIKLAEEAGGVKLYDFDRKPEERTPHLNSPPVIFAPRNPWDALHHKLILNPRDRDILAKKRGFTKETIEKLGYRTNNRANGTYIEELTYPREQLIQLGILQVWRSRPEPNAQLLGKGITGEKDDDGDPLWDWNEPIIIPYLDAEGHAFYLRPHKGGLRQERDEYDEDFSSSEVYCPFLLSDLAENYDGTVIITEGEFKAGAAFQARVPCIAIPGISFGKNKNYRKKLVELLHRYKATNIVVMFDNEVKDDPQFRDRFKPDPYDRHDTEMWALYLARDLKEEFESVMVGLLPNEWRIDGKADIDGALAGFVHGVKGHAAFGTGMGMEEGTRLLRRGLRRAIEEAEKPDAFLKKLPPAARNIVKNKLERRWNPPKLKSGGDHEEKLARRFSQPGHTGEPIDAELASAFRQVRGGYYIRKAATKEQVKQLETDRQVLERAIAKYGEMPEAEKTAEGEDDEIPGLTPEERRAFGGSLSELKASLAAVWERLHGLPSPLSDFVLRCEYKKHGADGNVLRLVRVRNRRSGKWSERLYELLPSESCAPKNFREWGHAGPGIWSGGQAALDTLIQDLDNHVEGRNIFEINAYGWHKKSDLWFYGDCAFNNGPPIPADASNIIWFEGDGYQVDSSVEERGTSFEQRAPLMLVPQDADPQPDLAAAEIFRAMTDDFHQIIGDLDAWLFIGSLAAYAIAPELLKFYGGHPGAWIYGAMGGGKTTIARWGMRMWGFGHLDGVGIDDRTTPVGMNRTLSQYSCLPVWFEEYRHTTINPQKEAVLRGAFDRNSGAKGMADGTNRTRSAKVFTTPVVTGESSSSDAATRSRYTQFNIAKSRRLPDAELRYAAVQESCKHYYLIGRFLMEHRAEFWALCEPEIKAWWEGSEDVKKRVAHERVRYVYAVARAAFRALCHLLGTRRDELPAFDDACLRFAEIALQDVVDETFTNQFWGDILSGIRSGDIEKKFFAQAVATLDPETKALKLGQAEGCFEVVFIAAKTVFDQYCIYIRKQGRTAPSDLNDMRRSIAREKYWLEAPKNSSRAHKHKINGSTPSCWAIVCDDDEPNGAHFGTELKELIAKTVAESGGD